MKYTKKQFLADVAKEAKKLKKLATKDEKKELDFDNFDATSRWSCIYGQMTGDCRSTRAINLIENCCTKFVINPYNKAIGEKFSTLKKYINGAHNDSPKGLKYFSSIEAYILMKDAKKANLIAYLKGERKDLVL